MTVEQFIVKYELNRAALARDIGMTRSCFCNKINKTMKYGYFKPEEKAALKAIFTNMATDILKITD